MSAAMMLMASPMSTPWILSLNQPHAATGDARVGIIMIMEKSVTLKLKVIEFNI